MNDLMDFQEVCSHFRVSRQNESSAQCFCPVHADGNEKHPSLTVTRGSNGVTLIYCHYCGKNGTKAILDAVGLQFSNIMPEKKTHRKTIQEFAEWPGKHNEFKGARFIDSYDYGNEFGYCFTKCRVSLPDGKQFRYCRTDVEGYVSNFNVPNRKEYAALYPFNSLLEAKSEHSLILYVEGEKDAKNAIRDGFNAVTAGSSNDWTPELIHHFEGLQVVIVPDQDEPGFNSANQIANDLTSKGITVKVIKWPETFSKVKGDYSDFIESFSDRNAGIEAFKSLINSALSYSEYAEFLQEWQKQNLKQIELTVEEEIREIAKRIRDIEGGKTFSTTDLKCGELIGTIFEDCRYNVTAKTWYWFNGKKWTPDAEGMHIEQCAAKFADALHYYSLFYMNDDTLPNDKIRFQSDCLTLSKRVRRVAVIQDARRINPMSSDQLDTDTALFNCNNGVLNLDTWEFGPHKREYMLSKIAGCDYLPGANRSDFPDFIDQIMEQRDDKSKCLQTFFGYALTGKPIQECALLLYGPSTRNGKTTLVDVASAVFGDYAVTLDPESLIQKKYPNGSGPNDDIARLAGKRLALLSEFPRNRKMDEALFKKMTGNNILRARHLNEKFFDFKAQFSIIMDTNFLPVVTDTTLFTSGRMIVLPFERHFEESEQDKGLKTRLQEPENLSAALNWMLEGLKRYQSEGLKLPESVISATEDYADDSDKIKRFITEELEVMPGNNVKASDVYECFTSWCKKTGVGTESKQNFFQLLRSRGLLQKTGTVNGKTSFNVVSGYKLPEAQSQTNVWWDK